MASSSKEIQPGDIGTIYCLRPVISLAVLSVLHENKVIQHNAFCYYVNTLSNKLVPLKAYEKVYKRGVLVNNISMAKN